MSANCPGHTTPHLMLSTGRRVEPAGGKLFYSCLSGSSGRLPLWGCCKQCALTHSRPDEAGVCLPPGSLLQGGSSTGTTQAAKGSQPFSRTTCPIRHHGGRLARDGTVWNTTLAMRPAYVQYNRLVLNGGLAAPTVRVARHVYQLPTVVLLPSAAGMFHCTVTHVAVAAHG